MSWLKGIGSWFSSKAWILVAILAAILAGLVAVVTLQRKRMAWLEAAVAAAEDRAQAAAARAEAHRMAAEEYQMAAAAAKRQLAILRAEDKLEQERVRVLRRSIDQARTAEEVLTLWEREFGTRP